jgi:hypothetical protein
MNAVRLSFGLPVLVINYADRKRYLDGLQVSNSGDLSQLIEFTIECLSEQLDTLQVGSEISADELTVKPSAVEPIGQTSEDELSAVLTAAGAPELDDPLIAILRAKTQERQRAVIAEFEAWRQNMLVIPAELKAIADEVNGTKVGFAVRWQSYDVLTFEKYMDMISGKRVARTWFVTLDVGGSQSRQ